MQIIHVETIYMKKANKHLYKSTQKSLLRKNRISFVLNDKEMNAFELYCKKFKVKNKSRLLREVLMTTIIGKLEQHSPTLFD